MKPASSCVMNVIDRARRKLNFDGVKESPMSGLNRQFQKLNMQTPGDRQKKISQTHLGDEYIPKEHF